MQTDGQLSLSDFKDIDLVNQRRKIILRLSLEIYLHLPLYYFRLLCRLIRRGEHCSQGGTR